MLVCTAVLVTVVFAPDANKEGATPPPSGGMANLGNDNPPKAKRPVQAADTGDAAEEEPKPKPIRSRRRSTPTQPGGGSPAPPPKKKPTGGTLTVKLSDPSVSQWVYITCPGGFAGRGSFSGGTAKVVGVPPESCTVNFKGGSPAKHVGVSGGQTVTCSPQGNIGNCR
jgi:hypothetical protein